MIDSQMDDMIKEKIALKQQIDLLEQNLSNLIKEKEYLLQTFTVFKNESKEKESKYMDKEIDLEKKIKELDNIVYKVGQSAQTVHIDIDFGRSKVNQLSEDFGKHFVPQQELSVEQAFWLQSSHLNTDQYDISPVKIEAPRELPKVSLVNTSLKTLKYHLGKFDTVWKKRITPDAIIEREWGFEHTKGVFKNEIIPFLKTLKDIFNVFDKDLLEEITEVQTVFNQIEAAVQQCFVDNQCFKIHKKELFLDNLNLVPPKETTSHLVETQKPEIKVYSRRSKQVKSVGSSKKSKIIKSRIANKSEPNHSRGSNAIDVPSSSSLINERLSRLFSRIWNPDAQNI
ncbi:hypothetical protein Tco_0299116 [Tanacetum coccineum]